MEQVKKQWVIWAVVITMILTLGTQYYWNAVHYQENRSLLLREIQTDLDNAVEAFYAKTSAAFTYTIIDTRGEEIESIDALYFLDLIALDSLASYFDDQHDLTNGELNFDLKESIIEENGLTIVRGKTILDSRPDLLKYPNRLSMTVHPDTIPMYILKSEFEKNQSDRGLDFPFTLRYFDKDSLSAELTPIVTEDILTSRSEFIPEGDRIELGVILPLNSAFKKGLFGISLSVILSATVLFCLLYLLRTIARQKKVSEIKDDFIGNLTHEFKTPIATASAALQALNQTETAQEDSQLQRYSGIAQGQLDKLNQMVEKLLETASLHAEEVQLAKEEVDLVSYNKDWLERLQERKPQGSLLLHFEEGLPAYALDRFHFENALSNIIENAYKYGKPPVEVCFQPKGNGLHISITDQGGGIPKEEHQRIFEKFYRIPSGNVHDVKGHGIGLYYAKTIIEKHGGQIKCSSDHQKTLFEIELP